MVQIVRCAHWDRVPRPLNQTLGAKQSQIKSRFYMDVLHTNNNFRGQSDVLRRPLKSGPHFVHPLTSVSQFEITVVRSSFQALQPALPRRQFKSKPKHLHQLTSASQFEITVVRSSFQALQPALPRRQFKSQPKHLYSLTLRKFTIDSAVACSLSQALQSECVFRPVVTGRFGRS